MVVPRILLDTDLETDCDAGAIAVLHALRKDGIIELAGISADSNYESSARFAAALNAACGEPEIPVCWNGSLPLRESYRTFLAPLLDSIVYHHLYVPPPENDSGGTAEGAGVRRRPVLPPDPDGDAGSFGHGDLHWFSHHLGGVPRFGAG